LKAKQLKGKSTHILYYTFRIKFCQIPFMRRVHILIVIHIMEITSA